MNTPLRNAVQKIASSNQQPENELSLNGYFTHLLKEAEAQGVEQDTASIPSTPSSSKTPGMEEKNLQHGKGDDHANLPMRGGEETGAVTENNAGQNLTGEASGIPDISLAKTAAARVQHHQKVARIQQIRQYFSS